MPDNQDDLILKLEAIGVKEFIKDIKTARKALEKGEISIEQFEKILSMLQPTANNVSSALSKFSGSFDSNKIKQATTALRDFNVAQAKVLREQNKIKKTHRNKLDTSDINTSVYEGNVYRKVYNTQDKEKKLSRIYTSETNRRTGVETKRVYDVADGYELSALEEVSNKDTQTKLRKDLLGKFNAEQEAKAISNAFRSGLEGSEFTKTANSFLDRAVADILDKQSKHQVSRAETNLPRVLETQTSFSEFLDRANKEQDKINRIEELRKRGDFYGRYTANRLEGKSRAIAGLQSIDIEGVVESTKKTFTNNKFVKSLARIALYRIIRTILSTVVNSFKEGFDLIKNSSNEVKSSLTELTASTVGLKVALASIVTPALEAFAPFLQNLSTQLIDVANAISYKNAMQKGEEQYWEINKEAVAQYAEQLQNAKNQLSELDKFAVVSGNPLLGGYKPTEGAVDSENKKIEGTENAIGGIIGLIADLFDSFTNLDNKSLETFAGIASAIIMVTNPLLGLLLGIGSLIALLSSDAPASLKIATTAALALAGVFYAMFLTTQGITKGIAGVLMAVSAGTAIMAAVSGFKSSALNGYAGGGFPSYGEVFVARENGGAEMVGTIGSRAAVANNDQIVEAVSQGVYGAVSRAFSENRSSGSGDVYLDGKKVGTVVANGVYTEGVKAGYWNK